MRIHGQKFSVGSNYTKSHNLPEDSLVSPTLKSVAGFSTNYQNYGQFGVGRERVRGTRKNRDYYDRVQQ